VRRRRHQQASAPLGKTTKNMRFSTDNQTMKNSPNRFRAPQGVRTARPFVANGLAVAVAQTQTRPGGLLDARLGVALLKDRRVPVRAKLIAVGLGVLAMLAVNVLELPVDAFIALLLPGIGVAADAMFNGAETIVGTMLASALIAPHVLPKPLVQTVRDERANA